MKKGTSDSLPTPQASVFHFCGYTVDDKNGRIAFEYKIEFLNHPPLEFLETIAIPDTRRNLNQEQTRSFLEPLHLILGISYYKLYCPAQITLPFALSNEQADFWNTVYRKGLGELMYRNNIDPETIAQFPVSKTAARTAVSLPSKDRILLGIGGGKDSIVAAELLRNYSVTSLLLETQKDDLATEKVMEKIGNPILKIKRLLDPKIFEKYEGSYNGHIPISAIYAFIGLLTSALYDYKYIMVGNEHTSNFGNLTWHDEEINHQWSKSAEFESMLQNYTKKYITPDITYVSLLRQFYEIRVAKMFVQHKQYFSLFTSCNKNFKAFKERPTSLWCGECPKCAYVFLLLAAFLSKEELLNIFKKNLFADEMLFPLYEDLLGFGTLKPFDCVGTFEESQAALFLASKHFTDEPLFKTFLPKIKQPDQLIKNVFRTTPAPTLPTPFKFLGIDSVCIVGYGKEGKITEQYLQKNYPNLKIGILDESTDMHYLEKQGEYDLAIKTPGISKTKMNIPYTTATNIFFSQIKNFTIGVTGSKGKSTTTSLIYDILKAGGKKVRLLGNIGNPMLEVLLSDIDPEEIFVIELSSYMLDDIEYSPNIAVLLNLFPEHMDYHGGVENYYNAKNNIFAFQKPKDIAVKYPFDETIPLKESDIPLIGKHNLENIKAAIKVAHLLDIGDEEISKAIKNFKPLPHRLQYVGIYNDILFYDDAISTTPQSTIMAIESLSDIGTIFLGGTDRGYDFHELETALTKHHIKNIVLFPESGNRILSSEKNFNVLKTNNMEIAVEFAFKHTPKGTICLLSTASPSYSIWKNFEEKGDLFQGLVKQYLKK